MDAFETGKKFFDDKNFPYGISKSGQFNIKQAVLLEKHGNAYKSLYLDKMLPRCIKEQNFVNYFSGLDSSPDEHTVVWARYIELTEPKKEHGAGCPYVNTASVSVESDSDDVF